MAYNFAYTGFPPPSNPRMMNPPPNIHAPPPPIFHNNNSPWRPPPERPQFNINSFMTPPHVMQRPSFPPQNMFTGCPVRQVQRPHFTPDNMFSQEASKGPQENFPFNNGPGFQNNAQHFQGHHGRGRGFMRGHSRGQGFRGGFRGGAHNGNQNGFNKAKQKQKVDKRDLPENNVYFCDICDRGFKTEDKYQEHVDGHIQCSFKDCPFVAAPKLVHLHARMQHSSGLAKKVWQVKSADDINKWREERKRNYPTAENVVRKKQEREEKIARGEVLHTKEFGKMRHDRGGNKRRGGRGKWRGRGRGRWRDYDNENEDYPQAVDDSDSEGPPEETVIRKSATDDEVLGQSGAVSDSAGTIAEVNTGTSTNELQAEVLSPQEPNISLTLLTSYGESSPDSQLSDDDCEKSPVESDTKSGTHSTTSPKLASPQKPTVTSSVGVSPPSAEPQNQATSQDVASTLEPSQSAVNGAGISSVHNSSSPHKSVSQDVSPSISSADPTAASPDSVPGQHQKHDHQSRGQNARKHKENQGNKRAAGSEQGNDPPHKKKKEQTKQPVHKYTLLEKLLAPDMRKERNKVLQCVHYIVKNKFFE